MSIIVVEGARRSGKSFLINSQKVLHSFKFDFNESFAELKMGKDSREVHYLGLGKELMLHQLNREGFLKDDFSTGFGKKSPVFIVDRGVISNCVWGVFQKRTTIKEAEENLRAMYRLGLMTDVYFIGVDGNSGEKREKDIWDEDDKRAEEERELFEHFYQFAKRLGNQVHRFQNNFNKESEEKFTKLIEEIENYITCAEF